MTVRRNWATMDNSSRTNTPPSPDRLEGQENGKELGQEKAFQVVQRGKCRLDPVGQEHKKHPVADGLWEREIHDALEGHPGAFVSVLLQDTEAHPAVSQEDQEAKDAPAQSRPPAEILGRVRSFPCGR